MPTFELSADFLEKCYVRYWVEVEADTEEEAIEKVKNGEFDYIDSEITDFCGLGDCVEIFKDSETIYVNNDINSF